jgi:hypothetical protein
VLVCCVDVLLVLAKFHAGERSLARFPSKWWWVARFMKNRPKKEFQTPPEYFPKIKMPLPYLQKSKCYPPFSWEGDLEH